MPSGHFPPEEQPAEIAAVVVDLVSS